MSKHEKFRAYLASIQEESHSDAPRMASKAVAEFEWDEALDFAARHHFSRHLAAQVIRSNPNVIEPNTADEQLAMEFVKHLPEEVQPDVRRGYFLSSDDEEKEEWSNLLDMTPDEIVESGNQKSEKAAAMDEAAGRVIRTGESIRQVAIDKLGMSPAEAGRTTVREIAMRVGK